MDDQLHHGIISECMSLTEKDFWSKVARKSYSWVAAVPYATYLLLYKDHQISLTWSELERLFLDTPSEHRLELMNGTTENNRCQKIKILQTDYVTNWITERGTVKKQSSINGRYYKIRLVALIILRRFLEPSYKNLWFCLSLLDTSSISSKKIFYTSSEIIRMNSLFKRYPDSLGMTPEGLLCDEFMESQVPVFVSKPKILNAGRSKEPSSMKSKPTTQYPAFIPISFGLSDKSKVGTKSKTSSTTSPLTYNRSSASKMSFREPVNKVDCYQNSMTPNEFLNSTYRTSPAEALKKAFASRSKKTEKRKTVSRWEAEKRSLIGYTVDFNSINQQYRDWNQKFEYDQVEEKAKTINEGLAIMKLLDMCAKVSRLNEVLAPMEFKIDQNYDFTIYSNLAKKLSCGGVKIYLPLVEMCRKANPRYPESISEITNWINKRSNHGFCINIMLGILSDYLLHPDIKNETKIDIYVKIFRNHIKYIDRYWGEYGEKVNCTNESYMQFCSLAYQLLKKTPTNNSSAYQTRDFEYDIIKYLRDARFVTKEFNLRELSENYERSVLDEVTVTNSVLNTRTRFYGSMDVIKGFRDKISKLYEANVEVINGLNKSVIVYAKKKNKRF